MSCPDCEKREAELQEVRGLLVRIGSKSASYDDWKQVDKLIEEYKNSELFT